MLRLKRKYITLNTGASIGLIQLIYVQHYVKKLLFSAVHVNCSNRLLYCYAGCYLMLFDAELIS